LVFSFFPVGRAKFLSKRNLDAALISPCEMCGLVSVVSLSLLADRGFRPSQEKGSFCPALGASAQVSAGGEIGVGEVVRSCTRGMFKLQSAKSPHKAKNSLRRCNNYHIFHHPS
jgi:hypothetical protein